VSGSNQPKPCDTVYLSFISLVNSSIFTAGFVDYAEKGNGLVVMWLPLSSTESAL
jgi:hypothetical protein